MNAYFFGGKGVAAFFSVMDAYRGGQGGDRQK
jgi:hypothetical protein